MKLDDSTLLLTATDLSAFSACRRATLLAREVAHGRLTAAPYRDDPAMQLLRDRGQQHEARYRAMLEKHTGRPVHVVASGPLKSAADWITGTERTLAAMRAGHHAIYQAPLRDGPWCGRADFLVRVNHAAGDAPSALGDYHYRAVDTKLAQVPRGTAVLQVCVYTELVGKLQGRAPDHMVIVSPAGAAGGTPVESLFRVADFGAYFRRMRQRMETFAQHASLDAAYPEPCKECEVCEWWVSCDGRRREDDHLSFVAGMTRRDQKLLEGAGVRTLEGLGRLELPMANRPRKLHADTLARLQHQALLQLEARATSPRVELLRPVLTGKGIGRLPEPSAGDVFFDVEVDRYAPDGTFVYLFGWLTLDHAGQPRYEKRWAVHRGDERRHFEEFVGHVRRRLEDFPELHVYHFAHAEKTVLGDLAGRYASREDEVDDLLRAEVLCDLLPVVKQGLRAGVEDYSLKSLERFYGFTRATDLREAARARRLFELAREGGGATDFSAERATIENYNREDCLSTLALRGWLEALRSGVITEGEFVERPKRQEKPQSQPLSAWLRRVEDLRRRLLDGVAADPAARTEGQRARQLLADVLDWHRRKEKPGWREYFRVRELTAGECFEESGPIGNLGPERSGGQVPRGRKQLYEYSFPAQEYKIRVEDELECPVTKQKVGEVVEVRRAENVVVVKRSDPLTEAPVALAVVPRDFNHASLQEALAEIADSFVATGFGLDREADEWGEPEVTFPNARALLLREPPRLATGVPLALPNEAASDAAVRVVSALRQTVLPIQGPPGAGKSYTGARMVLALLRLGKRVGITANSHEVVGTLLEKVQEAADEAGVLVYSVQKVTKLEQGFTHARNQLETDSGAKFDAKLANARALNPAHGELIAGTPYLWAQKRMRGRVDVLVIDEAGQFSLANALAVTVATDSLVMLGDPQQLAQPDKGSHPPGAGASALEHLLDGADTVPVGRGIFLDQTWRLPPSIASFTSSYFYGARLSANPGCSKQRLVAPEPMSRFSGSGIFFEPVEHEGNVGSSPEEAQRIVGLIRGLLAANAAWTDRAGVERPITTDDILVIAPYNLQVQLLREELQNEGLGAERVGTVDLFQGQEAPIVIYSMTTSSALDAPRGLSFLFDLRRLNVATSRAQAIAIVVASPQLLEAECATPEQMRLVNGLCGAVEVAR